MAPELLQFPNAITEACDIYSFGVVMWELWTSQEPFEGMQLHALLHQLTGPNRLKLPIPGEESWKDQYLASVTSSCNLFEAEGCREEDEAAALGPLEPVVGYKELMLRCWTDAPNERPTSSQLLVDLEAMMGVLRQMQRSKSAASRSSSGGPGSSGNGGR
jgi:serine/threonine protein kinase